MKNTFRIMIALMCMLAVLMSGFTLAEEAETTPAPMPGTAPVPTPSQEELSMLTFLIEGPDEMMPMEVTYDDFENGKLILEDLTPGIYTVTEIDPEQLLEEYTLNEEESVWQVTIEVKADEKGSGTLTNVYRKNPQETTGQDTTSPGTEGDGKVSIPVTKVWEDNNNHDGNRPEKVIVNLLGNGNKVAQAALSEASGWSWQFTDLPERSGGENIVYTVTEEPVPLYTAHIDGFTITNVYTPETTSASVMKVWLDNDNEKGMRPDSIRCTLNNGESVVLDASNQWSATIEGLPTIVNGQPAVYSWTEHETIGYERISTDKAGTTTIFTNALIERGETVPEGKKKPARTRGDTYLVIEEYQTAMGLETVINHVGDCFD